MNFTQPERANETSIVYPLLQVFGWLFAYGVVMRLIHSGVRLLNPVILK